MDRAIRRKRMNRELKNLALEKASMERWETYARLKYAISQELPKRDYKLRIFIDLHFELYGAFPDLENIFGKDIVK
jgi:hypothetical protein